MENQLWVDQVKKLLVKAKRQHQATSDDLDALRSSIEGALQLTHDANRVITNASPALRRKHLLAQVRLRIKHYALADEVQAFVLAAGHEVLESLNTHQLVALHAWLLRMVEQTDADDPFLRSAM